MKKSKGIQLGAVLAAMLLVNIIFTPAVVATQATPQSESTAPDTKSVYSDSNLPKYMQDQVIEAIKASSLSDVEKKELIKKLKDIWSNKSDLSESEQKEVLTKTASILYDYLRIDQSEVGIQWNSVPHSDLAKTAGVKMGAPSAYWQILYNEANTPDSWFRYPGDHFWYVDSIPQWGDGPTKTKQYANEARDYIKNQNNQSEGYKRLSWSMHYMSDLANPWHTVVLYGQAYHSTYENYVSDNWNTGHNFNKTIQDNWYYYYITDPEASAKSLAGYSNPYIEYLVSEILYDPNWRDNSAVISETKDVLIQAVRYDMGLVNYATR